MLCLLSTDLRTCEIVLLLGFQVLHTSYSERCSSSHVPGSGLDRIDRYCAKDQILVVVPITEIELETLDKVPDPEDVWMTQFRHVNDRKILSLQTCCSPPLRVRNHRVLGDGHTNERTFICSRIIVEEAFNGLYEIGLRV